MQTPDFCRKERRSCPLCESRSSKGPCFPYTFRYYERRFNYYRCDGCRTVFVDPLPDKKTLANMYSKFTYHDFHYPESLEEQYSIAGRLLRNFANRDSLVLDYGCGVGHFLSAIVSQEYRGVGVEFDSAAARTAAQDTGCKVLLVEEFERDLTLRGFDVIHMGDVLEHLPYPVLTLTMLLSRLKPGGILFVEGPLEENPSPVYWMARLFGCFKRLLRPSFIGSGTPTHLFRSRARQQLEFFMKVAPDFQLLHWEIYETGWPYKNSGFIKNVIAQIALLIGGKRLFRITFGNRFTGIFRYAKKL